MRQLLEILLHNILGDNYICLGVIGFIILFAFITPVLIDLFYVVFAKNPPEKK